MLEDLLSTVIFWALMGSRLIYAIVDPVATLQQPMRLLLLKGIVSVLGAVAGALAALVYLAWGRRVRIGDVNGAILLLASALPPLFLAWNPQGISTTTALTFLGPIHPVPWYYAIASGAIAAALWLRPGQRMRRFPMLAGALFLVVDTFRAAPLLLGPFTSLQVVGMAVLGLGVLADQSNRAEP